ncbi:hypothetical protein [Halodesulfurarchaeum sp.]|uniref:hypothetical protein n=1 Tax=Halodesulfurarchaeum sp. TaxID=1980530 RepID=UPI002FC3628F
MANRKKVAYTLFVVGILLLPGPLYLSAADNVLLPAPKAEKSYGAEIIDLQDEEDLNRLFSYSDRQIAITQYNFREDPEYSHQWNISAWQVLETAMANGSVTVSDSEIREEIQKIDARYQFVRKDMEEDRVYYRLSTEQNGSIVRTEPASDDQVLGAIADQAPRYENLTAEEKSTVDKILSASTVGGEFRGTPRSGYVPRVNEPFVDELSTSIWKGDTLYYIDEVYYVDRFESTRLEDRLWGGKALTGIGLLLVILGIWRISR